MTDLVSAADTAVECLALCRSALTIVAMCHHDEHQNITPVKDFRRCPNRVCKVAADALDGIDAKLIASGSSI